MKLLEMRDLAARWGKSHNNIRLMKHRGQLPEPDAQVGQSPAWYESTIEQLEATNGHLGADSETG